MAGTLEKLLEAHQPKRIHQTWIQTNASALHGAIAPLLPHVVDKVQWSSFLPYLTDRWRDRWGDRDIAENQQKNEAALAALRQARNKFQQIRETRIRDSRNYPTHPDDLAAVEAVLSPYGDQLATLISKQTDENKATGQTMCLELIHLAQHGNRAATHKLLDLFEGSVLKTVKNNSSLTVLSGPPTLRRNTIKKAIESYPGGDILFNDHLLECLNAEVLRFLRSAKHI